LGVHWKVVSNILEKDTGIKYNGHRWMTDYTHAQFESAKEKAKEKVLARTFLLQSDKEWYGPMLATLENDNTRGRNAYPDSRKAAFGFLNKWNTTYEKPYYIGTGCQYNNTGSSFSQTTKKEGIYCWGCGQEGVVISKCLSKACIKKCKEKNERKRATGSESGEQHLNTAIGSSNDPPFEMCDDDMMDQGEYVGYNTNYIGQQFTQSKVEIRYKEVEEISIFLDSQSTHSTFCSSKLLTNIRSVSSSLKMFSNGGEIIYKQRCELKSYGTVWFNEDAIANIISMSEAERKGHIISYTVGYLKLQNPSSGKVTSFHLTPGGLYAFQVPSNGMSLVQTVAENGKFFTPRLLRPRWHGICTQ
jgi:hypothetical protein